MALIFLFAYFATPIMRRVINMKKKITLWVVDVFSIMKFIEFIVKRIKRRQKKKSNKNIKKSKRKIGLAK